MMMVIVYVIAHEGSLITRDTISNNISNPPFEPQSESADQSWSSQAPYSFLLKPNSPFNPLLCLSDAIVWSQIALRKKAIKLFFGTAVSEKACQLVNFGRSDLLPPKKESNKTGNGFKMKGVDKDWELERTKGDRPIHLQILPAGATDRVTHLSWVAEPCSKYYLRPFHIIWHV